MNDKIKQFIEENTNKHLCKCGCGNFIIIKPNYCYYGIPKYIKQHHHRGKKLSEEHKQKIRDSWTEEMCNDARDRGIKRFSDYKTRIERSIISNKYWSHEENRNIARERSLKQFSSQVVRDKISKIKIQFYIDHPEVISDMSERTIKQFSSQDARDKHSAKWTEEMRDELSEMKIKFWQNHRWNNQVDNFINGNPITDWIEKPLNYYGISEKDYDIWRRAVYKRDHHTCQICGTNHCEVHAHHIIPQRINQDLILDINNGITMCRTCHELTYGKEDIYSEELQMIIDGII